MGTPDKLQWMEEMMSEVEWYAASLWVKALAPCLEGAHDALVDTCIVRSCVICVETVNCEVFSLSLGWGQREA